MDMIFDWNLGNMIYNGLITLRLCGFSFAEIRSLHKGGSATRILKVNQAVGILGDQEGVHDVLYVLIRIFTRLQQPNLTDKQWVDILTEPEVTELIALAREAYRDGCITHAMPELWVDE